MTRNEYYLEIARTVAKKSKDPSTKVGCVIVDYSNRPVSFGYNGWIAGCDEGKMTFERPMKYDLVIHAEMNALLFAERRRLESATMYCTHMPCPNCIKHALQCGVRFIVFDDKLAAGGYSDAEKEATRRLIDSVQRGGCVEYCTDSKGVSFREYLK